jgi:hypothetical protein
VWEFKLGGQVPVTEGAEAELIIRRALISDPNFLKTMESRAYHRVLDEGAQLLVGLTVKPESPPSEKLRDLLLKRKDLSKELGRAAILDLEFCADPFFVSVGLAGPTDKQARLFKSKRGGLWLITHGVQPIGLMSTTVLLAKDISSEPVGSLNHAYTKLSEIFEAWRISHTGNIYSHVLYREKNQKWYPLEVLRNRAIQQAEHEIAQAFWGAFMAKMTGRPQTSIG